MALHGHTPKKRKAIKKAAKVRKAKVQKVKKKMKTGRKR